MKKRKKIWINEQCDKGLSKPHIQIKDFQRKGICSSATWLTIRVHFVIRFVPTI